MHTDEYEISLSRELAVCEHYVTKYRRITAALEARHRMSAAEFLGGGTHAAPPEGDRTEWLQAHESLLRWSATRDEYRALLDAMKQSAPA